MASSAFRAVPSIAVAAAACTSRAAALKRDLSVSGPIRRVGSPVLHAPVRQLARAEIMNAATTLLVDDAGAEVTLAQAADLLHAALDDFVATHGFGRAIAANQLGFPVSLIAARLPVDAATGRFDGSGAKRITMANAHFTWTSPAMVDVWDDCFSFPGVLVRVPRHRSVSLAFTHLGTGESAAWERVAASLSELLQHETDHLRGISSFDRIDNTAQPDGRPRVVMREVFEANLDHFKQMVPDLSNLS